MSAPVSVSYPSLAELKAAMANVRYALASTPMLTALNSRECEERHKESLRETLRALELSWSRDFPEDYAAHVAELARSRAEQHRRAAEQHVAECRWQLKRAKVQAENPHALLWMRELDAEQVAHWEAALARAIARLESLNPAASNASTSGLPCPTTSDPPLGAAGPFSEAA